MRNTFVFLAITLMALPVVAAGPGDVNNDGVVDLNDLLAVMQHVGKHRAYNSAVDLNSDGQVNLLDVTNVTRHWGANYNTQPPPPSDTTPPTATITAPTAGQTLPAGTTSTTLAATTNEQATCRWSTTDTTYSSMTNTMAGAGTTTHTATISGLTNGQTYTRYIRCTDTSGNAMTASQSRTFSVAASTPPPSGSVLFESNWSTSTGISQTALTDGGRFNNWITCGGGITEVMQVIPGSSVGWSATPNVMQFTQRGPNYCGNVENTNAIGVGQSFYARMYIRDDETTGGWHDVTLNCCGSIQAALWSRGPINSTHTNARVAGPDGEYPYQGYNWHTPALPRGQWYRYEWHIEYLTENTARIWTRVYDMNNNRLVDEHNIRNGVDWGQTPITLAERYAQGHVKTFSDLDRARRFGVGNPGQAGSADTGHHWYQAGVKIVDRPIDPQNDIWVGPIN
jgi:hypothetical protein